MLTRSQPDRIESRRYINIQKSGSDRARKFDAHRPLRVRSPTAPQVGQPSTVTSDPLQALIWRHKEALSVAVRTHNPELRVPPSKSIGRVLHPEPNLVIGAAALHVITGECQQRVWRES